MRRFIRKIICLIWVFDIFCCMSDKAVAAEATDFEQIKKGIVEIQSGFNDSNGTFHKVKSGSGFLLSNTEGETYIVVGNSIAQTSKNEMEEFCKIHGIDVENLSLDDVIKVIVKGDVMVDAFLDTDSERKDFAILHAGNVLNEKKSLRLRDDFEWKEGENICFMAFQQEKENQEYNASDVNEYPGKIENKDLNLEGEYSFNFSSELPEDCIGGVLLDEEGYVIGIRNDGISDAENNYHAATSIAEIIEVLDNLSIYYDSSLKDEKRNELQKLYQECKEMCENGQYKDKSVKEMQTVLEEVKSLENMVEVSLESTQNAYEMLQDAKKGMVQKMEKIQIIFWVLAVVIALLLIWLIQLLIRNHLDKKKEQSNDQIGRTDRQVQKDATTKNSQNINPSQQEERHQKQENTYRYESSLEESRCQDYGSMDLRILNQEQKQIPLSLIRVKSGESFPLIKGKCVIGRGADADIQIKGNTPVSRKHAEILCENGDYYIQDLESLNGSYVNGKKLLPFEPQKIQEGDIVALANERFEIKNG